METFRDYWTTVQYGMRLKRTVWNKAQLGHPRYRILFVKILNKILCFPGKEQIKNKICVFTETFLNFESSFLDAYLSSTWLHTGAELREKVRYKKRRTN